MIDKSEIIAQLPYEKPFLFVDEIISVSNEGIVGTFTFLEDLDFYKGHFPRNPVTPGVILTECMAQIGLVCLGIYLLDKKKNAQPTSFGLSCTKIDFFVPVFPNERVTVYSNKIYFRFNKLRCEVKMTNQSGNIVASGIIDGMLVEEFSRNKAHESK